MSKRTAADLPDDNHDERAHKKARVSPLATTGVDGYKDPLKTWLRLGPSLDNIAKVLLIALDVIPSNKLAPTLQLAVLHQHGCNGGAVYRESTPERIILDIYPTPSFSMDQMLNVLDRFKNVIRWRVTLSQSGAWVAHDGLPCSTIRLLLERPTVPTFTPPETDDVIDALALE